MKIVIIEDEKHTALDLKESIEKLRPQDSVLTIVDSVEDGLAWFSRNPQPDLIFSDIKLGDGLAFDIFKKTDITCPVIFCTAYDEYAIEAFQNNGIDYLLKPIEEENLEKSLSKIQMLKNSVSKRYDPSIMDQLFREIESKNQQYKSTLLVTSGEKMIPINIDEIAYFNVSGSGGVQLTTQDGQSYWINDTLSHLQSVINPQWFYRVNRQFLVAYTAIKEVEQYFDRKLLVHLHQQVSEPITISKEKATDFLAWLEDR